MVRETILCMFPRMTKRPEVETGMEETVRLPRRRGKVLSGRAAEKEETVEKERNESGRRGGRERKGS
ncbi:hypothetical protein F2Q68_00024367 [Brassica cretica]|uniref:Uncharacterized protein n=2 Tax=Brassica cretica TaxID=69181 RepID=A0ABQ7DTB7_BRACR|nr:hypothetical protein F2Q68_00024367 [Brassica cretica]KAF3580914.1 hypothetical protein DY000_02029346 [Brassica cretica]